MWTCPSLILFATGFASFVASTFFSVATPAGFSSPPMVFLMELSIPIFHPDFLEYLGYSFRYGSLNLVCDPDDHLRGRYVLLLACKDPDPDIVLDALERLGQVPGVGVPVAPHGELVHGEPPELAGFPPEVRDVHDDELLRGLRVEEGKDEMGAPEPRVNHLDVLGELEALETLHYRGSKPVVRIERVAAACHHDLGIQRCFHSLHWMSFWATSLFSWSTTIMWVAHDTHGS